MMLCFANEKDALRFERVEVAGVVAADLLWEKRRRLPCGGRGIFAGLSRMFSKSGMHGQSGSLTNGAQTKTENAGLSIAGNVIWNAGPEKGPACNANPALARHCCIPRFPGVCQMLSPRNV
jgi:hypothetical protein